MESKKGGEESMGIEVHPAYFARGVLGTGRWHGGGVLGRNTVRLETV